MKKKYIVIGSFLVIGAIMVGSTLAWWTWSTSSNEQTNVVVTVGGITINYEDGENITNNNLIPTSTKEKGISKDITVSSTGIVYLDLNMSIVTLDDGLKDTSFKYEIYDGTNLLKKGNFVSNNIGNNISLLNGMIVTSTPVTYTLYIWIDGNMSNPNTMYNQNFEFRLNASATDQMVTFTGTELVDKIKNVANIEPPDFFNPATSNEGVFSAPDDYGTSYYFRGAVEYNYVKFAGYYWRIIRVNGDDSIRIIYDGTVAHANAEESDDKTIGSSYYNSTYGDNAYVGYMMGIDNECDSTTTCSGSTITTSYEQATTNTYDSTIKIVVDEWYKTNIVDKGYNEYVSDVIYCNDRSVILGNGVGITATQYGAYDRAYNDKGPIFTCLQKNDSFTVDDTTHGNGDLTYPVGLITIDEVIFAGAPLGENTRNYNYYLYEGKYIWTMSPGGFAPSRGKVYRIGSWGDIGQAYASDKSRVKPVISLKSSVKFTGNGTMDSPFEVVS